MVTINMAASVSLFAVACVFAVFTHDELRENRYKMSILLGVCTVALVVIAYVVYRIFPVDPFIPG